ncbi:MAG TPA: glycosyltransferase family 4 protein [Roseiflexaceae bacterium]|nr:glycosyltransferase family 4 protein [Roseiflexaceae bacterium]
MNRIGYIIRSYPRLSQTFILNEILALEELGVQLHLFPSTDPREPVVQAQAAEVHAPVEYLEQATSRGRKALLAAHLRAALATPIRYVKTISYVLRHKELDEGYTAASRWECLAEALHLAGRLRELRSAGQPIDHLHAHFAHDPTLIALLAHKLTGISYSFTAHARDLFQIPRSTLTERIASASAVITCCAANLDYLNESAATPDRGKIRLIHHGVDLRGFQPAGGWVMGDGGWEDHPTHQPLTPNPQPLILSVGRLVEKKGFPDLLLALGQLKRRGRSFRCAIYGEGPLYGELTAMIERLGLHDDVALPGAVAQRDLIPVFQQADIFALAPFVTEDGDRDGVPNVLVEAMACGLPVVSTAVSGIPELVADDRNGLLVAPHSPEALADALAALIDDRERRARLGAEARRTVVEHFDLRAAARELAGLFERGSAGASRTESGGWHRAIRRLAGIVSQ